MTTIKTTFIALAIAVPALAFSLPSQSANMPHIESALVDICEAAQSNRVYKLKSTIKSYGLKDKTVALKVMCNGDDIITFSEKNGALKTAAKLKRSVSGGYNNDLTITDLAVSEKEEKPMQRVSYANNR